MTTSPELFGKKKHANLYKLIFVFVCICVQCHFNWKGHVIAVIDASMCFLAVSYQY